MMRVAWWFRKLFRCAAAPAWITVPALPALALVFLTASLGAALADELLLFEEIPIVISASRQAQPINLSSVPVSIVTREDIRYSGATTLADLFHFVPGVDVLPTDRARAAIGVRGLHELYSDRTLTLVNGQTADSPLFGGSEFAKLPFTLADVERIEIVRGPGGAAWGANAFNGAINIITKDLSESSGFLSETYVSEFGDASTQYRWVGRGGGGVWRLSGALENGRSSEDALGTTDIRSLRDPVFTSLVDPQAVPATDFSRSWRIGGETRWALADDARLQLAAAHSHEVAGDREFLGEYTGSDWKDELTRLHARAEVDLGTEARGYVQGFANLHRTLWPGVLTGDVNELDLETQLSGRFASAHQAMVGGNVRRTSIDLGKTTPADFDFPAEPYTETWAGGFVLDRWQVGERLALEGQVRGDYYSETHTDWSGRATALVALDEERRRVLRFGGARAFRAPLTSLRHLDASKLMLLPGLYAVRLLPPGEELVNETIWSAEVGFFCCPQGGRSLRVDAYYQVYEDLIGYSPVNSPGFLVFQPSNIDGARALGTEVEFALNKSWGRLVLWYAFNRFRADQEMQSVRAFLPAEHKAGFRLRHRPARGWTWNLDYRYSDGTDCVEYPGSLIPAPVAHRLDLSFGRTIGQRGSELVVGVSDLIAETHEYVTALGSTTGHVTPGRHFFSKLILAL